MTCYVSSGTLNSTNSDSEHGDKAKVRQFVASSALVVALAVVVVTTLLFVICALRHPVGWVSFVSAKT